MGLDGLDHLQVQTVRLRAKRGWPTTNGSEVPGTARLTDRLRASDWGKPAKALGSSGTLPGQSFAGTAGFEVYTLPTWIGESRRMSAETVPKKSGYPACAAGE